MINVGLVSYFLSMPITCVYVMRVFNSYFDISRVHILEDLFIYV